MMIDLLIFIVLIGVLAVTIYQDCKYQLIHVSIPVILLILSLWNFLHKEIPLRELIPSTVFLVLVITGLFVYVSLKSKKLVNPIDSFLGLGDILFFLAIIPLFYVTSYVVFFISGMFFSAITHLLLGGNKKEHLPLAGYLSIYLIVLLLVNQSTAKELFYTYDLLWN